MAGDDDGKVSYSFRELFDRLEQKIDTFVGLLANKADQHDLRALEGRMSHAERRLDLLDERERGEKTHEQRRTDHWRWLIPAAAAVALAAATIAQLVH
jgi:anti-sigma-K factor RskA